jgi:hypothetical protein
MGCSTPHRFRSPCNKTVQDEIHNRPHLQLLAGRLFHVVATDTVDRHFRTETQVPDTNSPNLAHHITRDWDDFDTQTAAYRRLTERT